MYTSNNFSGNSRSKNCKYLIICKTWIVSANGTSGHQAFNAGTLLSKDSEPYFPLSHEKNSTSHYQNVDIPQPMLKGICDVNIHSKNFLYSSWKGIQPSLNKILSNFWVSADCNRATSNPSIKQMRSSSKNWKKRMKPSNLPKIIHLSSKVVALAALFLLLLNNYSSSSSHTRLITLRENLLELLSCQFTSNPAHIKLSSLNKKTSTLIWC